MTSFTDDLKFSFDRSVQELIANKADINAAAREDGSTPLHFAAMSGSFDCVRILIENKADVNKPSFALYTPLHDAAGVGAVECVKLLIENGAKVNAKNKVIKNTDRRHADLYFLSGI